MDVTDKLTAEVVRYMLFKAHKQPDVPVKREELTRLVTDNHPNRSYPGVVISNAQEKLKSIFGLEMVEIHRKSKTSRSKGASSQGTTTADVKVYVLRSLVSETLRKKFIETAESTAFSGFALVVVGIIQLAGGDRVPEETEVVWQQLRRLGIQESDENHQVFGNIKQAMETLAKQRYIQKDKVASNEGDSFVFELAERAEDEAFKKKLQDFIKKLVSGDVAGDDPISP
ncbi:hypothetical protein CY35_15G053400 [Sphagnum magellanicum]|nr:hypothetical protein CY35_15G053400 [Sphagnum magellanicum]